MTKTLSITGYIKVLDDTTEEYSKTLSISQEFTEITIQTITIAASGSETLNFGGVPVNATLAILQATYDTAGSKYLNVTINAGSVPTTMAEFLVVSGYSANGIDTITVVNPDTEKTVTLNFYICK
jgi:hypothetical protein